MRFGSVCSGIEAASVAWHPLGWRAAWLAEIEPFPSAVLAAHYPGTPNLGDMTAIAERVRRGEIEAPDVLAGGTPCQSFSVAGLRQSLADDRGNLTLKFVELLDAIDSMRAEPAIAVWENVPGVLSTKDNAFGCFLAGLAGEDDALVPPGRRWENAGFVYGPKRAIAWRTLDAQYFGLAQRRRRVFVVASARSGFDPAQVLFEWAGLRRDTAPRREAGQEPARCLTTGTGQRFDAETEDVAVAAHTLRGEGFDASEDGTGRGTPLAPVTVVPTLTGNGDAHSGYRDHHGLVHVAWTTKLHNTGSNNAGKLFEERTTCLDANSPPPALLTVMQVRRLTPRECERLQGFPDNYTLIPWRKKPAEECPDGPRYKALGNSWAVPVARWVGLRIQNHLRSL